MFLGLWGRMRKRREEKKKELERIQQEKHDAREAILVNAHNEFAAAREAHRQRQFQRDLEALKTSSLDARRDRMQGVLTARRACSEDIAKGQQPAMRSDQDIMSAQQFIQSVMESSSSSSSSSSDSSSCSSDSGSSSSSGDSGGSCGGGD